MNRWFFGLQSALCSLLLMLAGCGNPLEDTSELEPSSYLLTLEIGPSDTQQSMLARYGGQVLAWNPEVGQAILEVGTGQTHRLLSDGSISQAVVSPNGSTLAPEFSASGWEVWAGGWKVWGGGWKVWGGGWKVWGGGSSIPAPPEANNPTWSQIRLHQAHMVSRKFGAGVKVAVLDSGIDLNHPVFTGRLAPATEWKDFVDDDPLPQEEPGLAYGHGTGVAGLILQVAPKATILPLRVLGPDGAAKESQVIKAIKWATQHGAQVINLSFGSKKTNKAVTGQLRSSIKTGTRIVASAGNNGQADAAEFPARLTWEKDTYAWVMGVGSVDESDVVSRFSAYGSSLFGFAPGEKLYAPYPGNQVAYYNGTSFAAPLFSGALALAYSEMPKTTDLNQLQDVLWASLDRRVSAINKTARGIDFAPRLDVETLVRSLPGWTAPSVPNTFQ